MLAAVGHQARPTVPAVLRHLGLSVLTGTLIPTALFYVCLVTGNIWMALITALVWCYSALAWRLGTKRRTSALLWLTAVGLTVKTLIAFATGSTFIYFIQPALGDAAIALVFLVSLVSTRPAVARLARDFFPMNDEIAGRPDVKRLLFRLTLLWAAVCALKAVVTLWMLHALSLSTFVLAKSVFMPTAAGVGAALTIMLAVRVARREGLMHSPQLVVAS